MLRWLLGTIVVMTVGCQGGARSGFAKSWFRPKGEEWTILCGEFRAPSPGRQAEALARELKRAPGIRRNQVRVLRSDTRWQVLYGTYYRRIDPQTGRLMIPDALRRDLTLVRRSTWQRGASFAAARPISSPATNVGNPAWRLEQAGGAYTLLVAVFENTPDFYDRKAAAAEYARVLRQRGFEAYYRHGPISSEVTVGSFGPEALIEDERTAPSGGRFLVSRYSPEVQRLQSKGSFRFLLLNGHKQVIRAGQETGKRYIASRLVPVRLEHEYDRSPGEDR